MESFKVMRFVVALAVTALTAGALSSAQEPPMPKPGPEHAVLKMDVGTWDAVVEMTPAPGAPAQKAKGVEVNTLGCSGLCLISDFKADMMGTPFHGHGTTVWDPAKKAYVGSWTDSMSMGMSLGQSTYDPATKKWSGWLEGPDMTGKIAKSRSVGEWKDANTKVFRMYAPGPDGKEMLVMTITSTRRK